MLSRPIFFISGWGIHAAFLKENPYFIEEVILIDLPCLSELKIESIVDHLSFFIPEKSIILGWSLGGLVGIQLAYQYPEKVKKLVLISSSPYFKSDISWVGISQKISQQFLDQSKKEFNTLFDYFLSLSCYPSTNFCYKHKLKKNVIDLKHYKNCLISYLSILFNSDLRKIYSTLRIPLFHLVGEKDAISKVDLKALVLLNPDVEICLFPNAGHILFLTHAQKCHDQLMWFIKND